jgi:hypothetical protein
MLAYDALDAWFSESRRVRAGAPREIYRTGLPANVAQPIEGMP